MRGIQTEGVRQARLLMIANGYDPRLLFSIPNGAPKLFLAIPVCKWIGYEDRAAGLWIEVKRPGGKTRKTQEAIANLLMAHDFEHCVCTSPQEIVQAVLSYLGISTRSGASSAEQRGYKGWDA